MEKMMGMCMGMCAEMLTAIRQTNALAVHATPELDEVFGEWLKTQEDKIVDLVAAGKTETGALADALHLTEGTVRYMLMKLAERGKLKLTATLAG